MCTNYCFRKRSTVYISINGLQGSIENPISKYDGKVIHKTWPVIKSNWSQICLIAFKRWFAVFPDLRLIFKQFPNDFSMRELVKCNALLAHIKKIEEIISAIITSLSDDMSDFVNTVIDLGRSHYFLGAKQKYATGLSASIKQGIIETIECDMSTANAWDSLLNFVMGLMKLGIRIERDSQNKKITTYE